MEPEELVKRFTYHAPKSDQPVRYQALRNGGLELARKITAMSPPGRDQSLALTKLDEAIMWANAAIARGE